MQKVNAKALFEEGENALVGKGQPKNLAKAEAIFSSLLDMNLGNPGIMFQLATCYQEMRKPGIAIQLLTQCVQGNPEFGEAWNNLGMAYRSVDMMERAREAFKKAFGRLPKISYLATNVSATYVNQGTPTEAVKWADKALEVDPNDQQAKWHKGLALLELRDWKDGWVYHEARLDGGGNEPIALRNYHGEDKTPVWDGVSKGRVVVHGEQGLGDEIMFASCIPDLIATGNEIVLEPSPRSHGLFKRSFKEARVYGTHRTDGADWVKEIGKPDFKVALGSLPKFFRNSEAEFPKHNGYLKASMVIREEWHKRLESLGPRPKIGITWQGGVEQTAWRYRSVPLDRLVPILSQDADFVSLQYTPDAEQNIAEFEAATGLKIKHWKHAFSKDIDELAGLTAELDLVISVCQTAVHMAGALNVPCWVLTPSRSSWRYAVKGNDMAWYPSVELLRQDGDDWDTLIQQTGERLAGHLRSLSESQRRTA